MYITDSDTCNNQINYLKSIFNEFNLSPNSNIIDIGCGAGEQLKMLSNLGYSVKGIDINLNPQTKSTSYNLKGDFFNLNQTFDDFKFDFAYMFAPCLGSKYMNLENLFHSVNLILKPKSTFVFDCFRFYSYFDNEEIIKIKNNVTKKYVRNGDIFSCEVKIQDKIQNVLNWYYPNLQVLEKIISVSGFKIHSKHFDFNKSQMGVFLPQLNKRRLTIVLQKN